MRKKNEWTIKFKNLYWQKKLYRSSQTYSVITSVTCVRPLITAGILVRASKNSIGEVDIRHYREKRWIINTKNRKIVDYAQY